MVPSSSASMDRSLTHDAEDIAIVASGAALQQVQWPILISAYKSAGTNKHGKGVNRRYSCLQVSQWLGVSADEVLQEANAEVDKMFAAPHPQL